MDVDVMKVMEVKTGELCTDRQNTRLNELQRYIEMRIKKLEKETDKKICNFK